MKRAVYNVAGRCVLGIVFIVRFAADFTGNHSNHAGNDHSRKDGDRDNSNDHINSTFLFGLRMVMPEIKYLIVF